MITPIWLTSWGHGVVSVLGGGLADIIVGTPKPVTSPVRNMTSYSLEINAIGSAIRYDKAFLCDNCSGRFYFLFSQLPTADAHIAGVKTVAGSYFFFGYNNTTGKIAARIGTAPWADGPSISLNTWYRIDYRAIINTTPRTLDWSLNGVVQTSVSGGTASTIDGSRIGTQLASETYKVYYNSVIVSSNPDDYPIGDGVVVAISPNADGTHNAGTNIIEDGSNNDIGAVTAWNLLDDVPLPTGITTDRVQQTADGVGNYFEVGFADIQGKARINGCIGILDYSSASTLSNAGATIAINSDNVPTVIFGAPSGTANMSENPDSFYKSAIITPPVGGWTPVSINSLTMRGGYSGDANPDPYWNALMIEVDYQPIVSTLITNYQSVKRSSYW